MPAKTQKPLSTRAIADFLVEMHAAMGEALPRVPWVNENERWAELLSCVLIEGAGLEESQARWLVSVMEGIDAMPTSATGRVSEEERQLLQTLLAKLDLGTSQAHRTLQLIEDTARAVHDSWQGYVQRFLRDSGSRMASELGEVLSRSGVDEKHAQRAAALWLQNVLNMPILCPHDDSIRSFVTAVGISEKQLLEAADEIGMSAIVLDDLVRFAMSTGQIELDGKTNATRKRGNRQSNARTASPLS